MKYFKKIAAVVLTGVMLVSLAGCGNTVKKVDEDKIRDVMKAQLGIKRGDCYEHEEYELRGTNYEDVDDPYIYEDVYYLRGSEHDDDEDVYVSYYIFDDADEADEYFSHYYEAYSFIDKKYRNYKEGKNGYCIDTSDEDTYLAMYYADDMVIEISAFGKDSTKNAKKFAKKLGFPAK